MYAIGEKVIVNGFGIPKAGVVVNWYYDEGNVWVVKVDGSEFECCDSELSPKA